MSTGARLWHLLTFATAAVALVLQTVLVIDGAAVLDEAVVPPLGTRLVRLVSYFTIQSNVLVAVVTGILARDPARDGAVLRVLRLDAVIGITVTGLVHLVLLRPLLDLKGANAVADALLHVVVPALALLGWLVFGPRPRVSGRTVGWALLWPVVWLLGTLAVGAAGGWYPYPFINADTLGYSRVLLNAAVITVLFLALFGLAQVLDRRLPAAPETSPPAR